MMRHADTVHASAVRVGDFGVLIRGPSGAGKSRLAFDLILAGRTRQIPATHLIGDDRIELVERGGALIARSVAALAGLIEIRGLGIRRCDHVAEGIVGLIVDLDAEDAARLPEPEALRVRISTVSLPRLPIGTGFIALPLVIAALTTAASQDAGHDCPQEMINHIGSTLTPP